MAEVQPNGQHTTKRQEMGRSAPGKGGNAGCGKPCDHGRDDVVMIAMQRCCSAGVEVARPRSRRVGAERVQVNAVVALNGNVRREVWWRDGRSSNSRSEREM